MVAKILKRVFGMGNDAASIITGDIGTRNVKAGATSGVSAQAAVTMKVLESSFKREGKNGKRVLRNSKEGYKKLKQASRSLAKQGVSSHADAIKKDIAQYRALIGAIVELIGQLTKLLSLANTRDVMAQREEILKKLTAMREALEKARAMGLAKELVDLNHETVDEHGTPMLNPDTHDALEAMEKFGNAAKNMEAIVKKLEDMLKANSLTDAFLRDIKAYLNILKETAIDAIRKVMNIKDEDLRVKVKMNDDLARALVDYYDTWDALTEVMEDQVRIEQKLLSLADGPSRIHLQEELLGRNSENMKKISGMLYKFAHP